MTKRFASLLLLALTPAWPALAASKTVTFDVKGWTCGSCAAATRIALRKIEGVETVTTEVTKAQATVTYDDAKTGPNAMVQAIERLGYKAAPTATTSSPARSAAPGSASAPGIPASGERLSFFEVPLGCAAAEGLGCGSAAKPVLRALERNPIVEAAKINHAGSVVAVVWKDPGQAVSAIALVEAAFKERDLETAPLRGPERERALKEFETARWYTAADVDRLSEREAEIIAARLAQRASPRLGLSPERLAALTQDLAVGIARILTRDRGEACDVDPYEELTALARKHLNQEQLAELQKAADQGAAALPGEAK
jgi:mercuric ion binding protein